MEIDIRPLFQCEVLVIREDPFIEGRHKYHNDLVTLWNKWDAREAWVAQCTPTRKCNLTAAGKTYQTEDEHEATYQASQ